MPELTISRSFYRMHLMKLGIFAAFLFWIYLSTSWGQGLSGNDDSILDINEIEVHQDPDIRPPVVDNKKLDQRGRIVINVRNNGSITGKDLQILETDEAIKNYIVTSKEEFVAEGKEPTIHCRGEEDAVFKFSRNVIKIASDAGVDQVVFAVYQKSDEIPDAEESKVQTETPEEVVKLPKQGGNRWTDLFIKPREQDLGMALPKNDDADQVEKKLVEIHLNAKGQVFIGKDKKALDHNSKIRHMPLLTSELEKMMAPGDELAVTIYVEPAATQQRVIDLLNTLAGVGISSVTFSDLIEE